MPMFLKYLSEFFGTFFIVLIGCGAIVINQECGGAVTHFGISLAFGVVVSSVIYLFAKHSTHFNPAVSITLFMDKKLSFKHLVFYLFFQIIGAVVASSLLHVLFPLNVYLGSTNPTGSELQSFVLEFILTFLLLALIFILEKHPTKYAYLIIGFLIFLGAYFAGPYCGASINPARSIGPAIISGYLSHLWLYVLAPIMGALTALLTKKLLLKLNF